MEHFRKGGSMKNKKGMTLIEVLIALVIISIALTAIMKATSQSIRHTDYLQQKIIAEWVGTDVMNEVNLGLIVLPRSANTLSAETIMLGKKWFWTIEKTATPNPRIRAIQVNVFNSENKNLVKLIGYIYEENI